MPLLGIPTKKKRALSRLIYSEYDLDEVLNIKERNYHAVKFPK